MERTLTANKSVAYVVGQICFMAAILGVLLCVVVIHATTIDVSEKAVAVVNCLGVVSLILALGFVTLGQDGDPKTKQVECERASTVALAAAILCFVMV